MTQPLFPRTPVLNGSDVSAARNEFREYFLSTFNRYELLFETLANEDSFKIKPIAKIKKTFMQDVLEKIYS